MEENAAWRVTGFVLRGSPRLFFIFAFGKFYGRGALNRFFVILILIETRAVQCFQLLPILNFCFHGISVLDVKS